MDSLWAWGVRESGMTFWGCSRGKGLGTQTGHFPGAIYLNPGFHPGQLALPLTQLCLCSLQDLLLWQTCEWAQPPTTDQGE